VQALEDLRTRLSRGRSRLRSRAEILRRVDQVVSKLKVGRYLVARVELDEDHVFRQLTRGRPGKHTKYRRITRPRYRLHWSLKQEAIDFDRKSDGMYPVMTNDRSLTPEQAFRAHKGQPTIEKRFAQLKSVHELAPVFLKSESRIEAFFLIYFLALLIQALLEREIRRAMAKERIAALPIYPEQRRCKAPTTEQILRLFAGAEVHTLYRRGRKLHVFREPLTDLQDEVLRLLGVPRSAYARLP